MFFVFARYRYPLVPFLMLFAARAVDRGCATTSRALLAQGARRLAVARRDAAIAVFANWPLLSSTLHAGDHREQSRHGAARDGRLRRGDRAPRARDRAQARLRARLQQPRRGAARGRARSTRRSRATDRRSSSSPTSPARTTTSPTRCSSRARPAIRRSSFRRALGVRSGLGRSPQQSRHRARRARAMSAGAIAEFRAALAIDDRSVHAHRNLGNMLVDAGQRAEGMAHLERAVALAPVGARGASTTSARSCCRTSDFDAAAARFEAALADSSRTGPRRTTTSASRSRRRDASGRAPPLRARGGPEAVDDRRPRQSRSSPRRLQAMRAETPS